MSLLKGVNIVVWPILNGDGDDSGGVVGCVGGNLLWFWGGGLYP